ncbi:PREDICTED: uncharacterized protein LOC104706058 [Camelina sativa]|uniref:Uncharacterized protein LOC104706058 n=1 Tax=Camelina sativa TaxID=90675 RepID=A0ABM0T3U4_CAMSA|nr:PREDICTED: uncharacterized protein LOC104706058 [Camelina sativa]
MDQRKGDPRIYIVTLLFLSCILSGGVLLGLYLVQSDPNPLFLQAGMFFVGVPWLFWFLAYVYSCVLKPCTVSVSKSVANYDPEKGDPEKNVNKTPENVTATSVSDPALRNSPRGGEKHVQFGNVVVLGDEEGGGGGGKEEEEDRNEGSSNNLIQNHMRIQEDQEVRRSNSRSDDESSIDEDCDRTPLRLSVANK